jgi:hypothetical protein
VKCGDAFDSRTVEGGRERRSGRLKPACNG